MSALGGRRFNEAAGFTQRKLRATIGGQWKTSPSFNEAAGFTQRKRLTITSYCRPCLNCFNEAAGFTQRKHIIAPVYRLDPIALQ